MINKEVWKKRCKQILAIDAHPGHIAAGFAVGVFISFTPFFGLHTPMAIVAAVIFRLNKLTTITGAWINTPITVVPVLIGSYQLGAFILGRPPTPLNLGKLDWDCTITLLKQHGEPILLGSSLLGFAAALAGYAICYWLVVRFRRKDAGLAELTREMEEVGEDLE
jgi:uncharacterized protein (DUF2062 family)